MTLLQKSGYLHAVVTGPNSLENVKGYLRELLQECVARECFRVLVEERLEGPRLGTLDVFEIASEGSLKARGTLQAIAYVDVNAQGDLMKLAETLAMGRSLPVKFFPTVAEAEKWLLAGG